ncbi:MAG TPA: hypothetical protein VHG28_01250 [Longimicrobiaceae bacterium]|nr:hypothetical protein [Longimicrobiaceae bacterium]
MGHRYSVALVLASLLAVLSGGRALAQAPSAAPVEAIPSQGLAFGSLLPGVPERVQVGDGARRAEIVLRGQGWIELSFMLPQAMLSPSGARIPLRFQANDGAMLRNSSSGMVTLNPLETNRIHLNPGQGMVRILLGGTAFPAQDQAAGRYTATIVVVATTPGT